MANITLLVSDLKTIASGIPANRNASVIIVANGTERFVVGTNYVIRADGSESILVQGYIDWQSKSFIPVP